MDNPKVNDGGGLYDNEGICDKGILLCNDAVKAIASGQYIGFCDKITQIVKIFANLKTAIHTERESWAQKVEDMKSMNNALIEKDGVE